ncbi:MAG: hypothetical protein OWS03_08325 [Alicyclobacillaceae bacterium]|nr:hypothetical protein [Alicyclobacillaceae bacterium]
MSLLTEDKVHPMSAFNAGPVTHPNAEEHIRVETAAGTWVTLNAKNHPVLFAAYWCPHCQRTLVLLQKHIADTPGWPTVVYVGYPDGFPLKTAVRIEHEEKKAFHLTYTHVYYLIGSADQTYIHGFPYLVFNRRGTLLSLFGEHTFPVWKKALDDAAQNR